MARRSERTQEGVVIVDGPRLLAEAVAADLYVETVFHAPGASFERPAGADVVELAAGVLERVSDVDAPQGCVAIVRRPVSFLPLHASFVVVAAGVGDPGNLGTIIRSAEAAGADAVMVTAGSADVFSPKTTRASAGAVFHVAIVDGDPRTLGLRLIGTDAHVGTPFYKADLTGPLALVLGNETHGVAADLTVDEIVTIPHVGRSESLNVAMAATVLCFEVARQRGARR